MATEESATGEITEHRYSARLAQTIESRWQRVWAERGAFNTPNPVGDLADGFELAASRQKLYVMDMFPYPSGSGLHVGHPLGYIASDVYARFMRMNGYEVLHPFGFDAFGLPAEQYAIDTGQHPAVTTTQNIDNMRRQLRRLGLSHDPRREVSTADSKFYRWTQWIFLKVFNSWFDPEQGKARPIEELCAEFESGMRRPESPANPDAMTWGELTKLERQKVIASYRLAYLDEAPVNWCPGLGTVLANEEVTAEGRSEVGNYPVYRRRMRQWMMRITAYADRLLEDLDLLDWAESLKTMQRNWIGRSEGAEIRFSAPTRDGQSHDIDVYTTRPDTIFGATCLVLAPEHSLVDELTALEWPDDTPRTWQGLDALGTRDTLSPAEAIEQYRRHAAALSDRQRQIQKNSSGVFTGTYAMNPASGERIPIFIADYVLAGYGSGAVMGVPAHDQRDFEFARRLGLQVRAVVRPTNEWLREHSAGDPEDVEAWHEAFEGFGVAINSKLPDLSIDGMQTPDARDRVVQWLTDSGLGTARVSYRLRDWLFSRQRYWGEPFPIVYDETDVPLALPESMLPVELPAMSDFRPKENDDDEPRPPLSRAPGFEHVTLDIGDGPKMYRRETNTMPQWAGSCWYYLRYLDPNNDSKFVDPLVERYWMGDAATGMQTGGVDFYIGGVEHAVLHLLYARFWHKVLFDLGHVSTPEPFQRLYNQGYILADAFTDAVGRYVPAEEVEKSEDAWRYRGEPVTRHYGKMGKSLKNAVSPDDIYESYGADTLRMYEMAMGPLDVDRPWQPDDIVGVHRFLQRLWRSLVDEKTGNVRISDTDLAPDAPLHRTLHKTIDVVDSQYRELRYNVAVARLTELNNTVSQYVQANGSCPRDVAESLTLMVAPLAPHIAAELWEKLGHTELIDNAPFPVANTEALAESEIVIPVTVDGRPRGEISVSKDASEVEVTKVGMGLESVERLLQDREVVRVIYVPGKVVNLVTRKS